MDCRLENTLFASTRLETFQISVLGKNYFISFSLSLSLSHSLPLFLTLSLPLSVSLFS